MGKRLVLLAIALAVLALGVWYVMGGGASRQAPTAAAPPPPEVGVVTMEPSEVPLPGEYAGRVVGFRDVEVRALVGGILLKRGFDEGARVEQGQVLFQIDPSQYQVALDRAQAQHNQAQASLRQSEDNLSRVEELFRRGVSTEKVREEAITARDQARASVQLAEAEIANAKLNLSYTEIHAPVNGVTALTSPAIGSLVLAQQTLLTTITPVDPAYVSFSFTDEEGRAFRELNARRAKSISETDLVVELEYASGAIYPHPGKIDTAARRVDPQTGTIQARAVFPNPEGYLLPGQFVRLRIKGVTLPDAIVVPKAAVSQGPQGPLVFVVGQNNVAEARPIRLGPEVERGWVVREGLKAGDQVIADGVIRVRPGAPVRPKPISASEVPPAAAQPAQRAQ